MGAPYLLQWGKFTVGPTVLMVVWRGEPALGQWRWSLCLRPRAVGLSVWRPHHREPIVWLSWAFHDGQGACRRGWWFVHRDPSKNLGRLKPT